MKRIASWALLITLASCGGDAKSTAKQMRPKDSGVEGDSQGLRCGSKICSVPADAGTACCVDRFTGGCGMLTGGTCRPLPSDRDDACPDPDLGGLGYAGGASSSIHGCCAPNNECGINLGIGLGCTPAAQTCELLPRLILERYHAQTCDGDPLTLPADCGTGTGSD